MSKCPTPSSGLFVVVSWISFLVNPEVIPGRMTLLVTIFLVLINIFNTIQTNSPKAEGLTGMVTLFVIFNLWSILNVEKRTLLKVTG